MEYKDKIHSETKCQFSIIDRIRILFKGIAIVRVITATENLVGEVHSTSSVYVPRIFVWRSRKMGGYEHTILEPSSDKGIETTKGG